MKRNHLLFYLLVCLMNCAEEEAQDIAALVVGEYTGTGSTSVGGAFSNKGVLVYRLSNTKIRVEPMAGNPISAFETSIMLQNTSTGDLITSNINSGVSLAVTLSTNPVKLSFENFNNSDTFTGDKN